MYFRIRSKSFHVWTGGKNESMKQAGIALLALAVGLISGCERHSNKEVFYLVTANSALPYWQTAASGFNHAAADYKVTAKVVGPEGYDAQAELAELNKAVAAKPAGILISVADAAVLQTEIDAAIGRAFRSSPLIPTPREAAAFISSEPTTSRRALWAASALSRR